MDNKDLIKSLAKDRNNSIVRHKPGSNFYKWLAVSVLSIAGGVFSLGLRGDWTKVFEEPTLLLQNMVLMAGFIITGFVAFQLSSPGSISKRKASFFASTPIVLWTIILGISLKLGTNAGSPTYSFGCIRDILIVGVIPGAALFVFLSQGVVLNRMLTGVITSISLLGVGAWAVQFTCHNDNPVHIFVSHFVPIIVCSIIGAGLFMTLNKKL